MDMAMRPSAKLTTLPLPCTSIGAIGDELVTNWGWGWEWQWERTASDGNPATESHHRRPMSTSDSHHLFAHHFPLFTITAYKSSSYYLLAFPPVPLYCTHSALAILLLIR